MLFLFPYFSSTIHPLLFVLQTFCLYWPFFLKTKNKLKNFPVQRHCQTLPFHHCLTHNQNIVLSLLSFTITILTREFTTTVNAFSLLYLLQPIENRLLPLYFVENICAIITHDLLNSNAFQFLNL